MDLSAGQIVYAKRGRDAGLPFIVVAVADGYAMLVDGKRRPVAKPKRKKIKHIRPGCMGEQQSGFGSATSPMNQFAAEWIAKSENGQMISDSDVRKALAPYRGQDRSIFE